MHVAIIATEMYSRTCVLMHPLEFIPIAIIARMLFRVTLIALRLIELSLLLILSYENKASFRVW